MIKRTDGITFLEIMIATLILSIALLPVFFMLNKGTEDTDLNAAQAFAINKATEVLNTILDSVPFEALRIGNPGLLCTEDIKHLPEYDKSSPTAIFKLDDKFAENMSKLIFGNGRTAGPLPNSWNCQGIVSDPRGISYLLTLSVEEVADLETVPSPPPEISSEFPEKKIFSMGFFVNPLVLSAPNWIASYVPTTTGLKTIIGSSYQYPRFELEQKKQPIPNDENDVFHVAAPRTNIFQQADFTNPLRKRLSQKQNVDAVRYNTPDKFTCMKRLILEVQWVMEKRYFKDPRANSTAVQRIHLIAFKGDVAR